MKRGFQIPTTLLLLLTTSFASADILVVDNNPGAPTPYSNIQTAVNAASDGDTIYVQPSGLSYGSFTVDKRLIIIGGGVSPRKQNTMPTAVGSVTLADGSGSTVIMGLRVDGPFTCSDDSLNNILIANCMFNHLLQPGNQCSNWIIEGSLILGTTSGSGQTMAISYPVPNLLVQNCIFSRNGIGLGTPTPGYMVFRNNIFIYNGNEDVGNGNSYWPSTVLLENNIYFGCKIHGFVNGQWLNNCFYLTTGFSISNTGQNSGNITGNPQFTSFSATPAQWTSFFHDFTLQSGSPCLGAGTNGTDIGLFGGSQRFNPGIQPPIPQVMSIQLANSAVPSGGQLQFNATLKKQD
jgi:hypothetical protein